MTTQQMSKDANNDKTLAYGFAIAFHLLLLALLFFTWKFEAPNEKMFGDGIPLRFGNTESAGGNDRPTYDIGSDPEPSNSSSPTPTPQPTISPTDKGRPVRQQNDKRPQNNTQSNSDNDELEREAREMEQLGKNTPNNGKGEGPGQQGGKEGGLNQDPGKGLGTLDGQIKGREIAPPDGIGNFDFRGTVEVYICIDRDGSILSTSIRTNSTGRIEAESAALEYAKKFKFIKKENAGNRECGTLKVVFKLK